MKMIGTSLILVSALATLVAGQSQHYQYYQTDREDISVSFKEDLDTGKTSIRITCSSSSVNLHYNFTNKRSKVSDIDALTIESCAFPTDGFRLVECLSPLGVEKIDNLKLSDPQSALKREHLQGLSLENLEFYRVNFLDLPGDLLRDVEVRENLFFSSGSVPAIPNGFFEHVSNLKTLHFFSNRPLNLHRGDLAPLTKLNTLVMFSNRLALEEGVFDGLENLEVLSLSGNQLQALPAGIFHKLKNLGVINLSSNQLNEISSDLLQIKDSKLRIVRLSYAINSLPAGLFKDLRNLEHVELNRNYNLTSLPADLFSGAGSLKKVELTKCNIRELPAGIFDDATELVELDLSHNQLTSLPENVFSKTKLQKLNLNYNKLTNLTEANLDGLKQLESLSVAHNTLSYVYPYLHKKIKSVKEIDISHNQLTLQRPDISTYSIFTNSENLRKLDASYNKVSQVFDDFQESIYEKINLAGNEITNITALDFNAVIHNGHLNLSSNKIASINLAFLKVIADTYASGNRNFKRGTVVELNDNPLHCGCAISDLVRYFENKLDETAYDYVTLNARSLRCASPPELANHQVVRLNSSEIFCPVVSDSPDDACSGTCTCLDYPGKGVLEVDCSNRNLTSAPQKIANPKGRPIELNLSGNQLERMPAMNEGYLHKVVSLDLSSNKISSVTADVLAGSLRTLKLQNNANLVLDSKVVKSLKGIFL